MKRYWNNLRPFEKRVVAVVLAVVFVVFNVWFVLPHFSDWGKVKIRNATAHDKLKKYREEVAQITTTSNEVYRLEHMGASVPAEEQQVQFLRTIQTEATRSQVNIISSGRLVVRTNQFFLEMSQVFNLQSGESQLVSFLFNLGATNSLLRVRELTVGPDAPHQALNTVVKLVASFQKKPPARTAPAVATKAAPNVNTNMVRPVPTNNPTKSRTSTATQTNKSLPGKSSTPNSAKRP